MDSDLVYPVDGDGFSPDESFPEYRFASLSNQPNAIYRAVRETFSQTGLDLHQFGTPEWNPLGTFIKPGQRVFILCNFVYHKRFNESDKNFLAKCTHGSVLRAIIDYVLIATGPNGQVCFGNAPIQSCVWENVLKETGAADVEKFYRQHGLGVQAKDLRCFISEYDFWGRELRSKTVETEQIIDVSMGIESWFSTLNGKDNQNSEYRVYDYNPNQTKESHSLSRHHYFINREILNADVVISLPKMKTHEKVGITCGLKGFVGIIGHKECLAHYRFGSPNLGGDEYPYNSRFRYAISRFSDWTSSLNPSLLKRGMQIVNRSILRLLRLTGTIQGGSWYGNDTAWRMALDLAQIAHYCDRAGHMQETKQRNNLILVDGVIGGEGNGPLSPEAINSGILVFSDEVALGDLAVTHLMGWNPVKLPIIREAFTNQKFSLTSQAFNQGEMVYNKRYLQLASLSRMVTYQYKTPDGWYGHVKS